MNIRQLRAAAKKAGKKLEYNRCTGEYQIVNGFTRSFGVIPARDEKNRMCLSERDVQFLFGCI